jgi:putative nucleotidyltransferase with HDIG domain
MRNEVDEMTKKIYGDKVKFVKAVMNTQSSPADIRGLPTREEAQKILEEHVKEPYQLTHAKMVASGMEMYAHKYNGNQDLWYIAGLLHDLDYYEHPDDHPREELKWFAEWGYPEELIQAVSAHAFGSKRTDTPPKSIMDFALIACDEMSGLLYAYSLMRPTKFEGMEAKSAVKKFKDKAFAAKIDREEIKMGVEGLGIELKEHAQNLIDVFSKLNLH